MKITANPNIRSITIEGHAPNPTLCGFVSSICRRFGFSSMEPPACYAYRNNISREEYDILKGLLWDTYLMSDKHPEIDINYILPEQD